jgi:hypothetical protein
MQPFRATMTDDAGQVIADVEGSIQSPEDAQGPRTGRFEFQDTGSFMQQVMDEKSFRLQCQDGSRLTIAVASVSTSTRPGYSSVEFTCS